MSSRAMASPAPVLGDFTPTFRALAEEPLREDAVGAEAGFSSVFESKSFTASRTRDFRSCEEVGRTGPKVGNGSVMRLLFLCRKRRKLTSDG